MSDAQILGMLNEILAGAREGKQWRDRAQDKIDKTQDKIEESKQTLAVLSNQLDELEKIVNLRLENGIARFGGLEQRLLSVEEAVRSGGGGAVDVNISQGNQTVGAEPAASATKPGLLKPTVTVGGGGFFGWLAGGGWEQIVAAFKKLTG